MRADHLRCGTQEVARFLEEVMALKLAPADVATLGRRLVAFCQQPAGGRAAPGSADGGKGRDRLLLSPDRVGAGMDCAHEYEIRVRGHLAGHWSPWFEGLEILPQADGTTILQGTLADQAALQGVLLKVFNLGLTLIAVTPVGGPSAASEHR